ncbi:FemAB family XrtA/PEP-CTERM system-associated protein [Desertibaculum subflavum]|uniref:FemAB family XrtA/PEP-CTERM system-associated protein n=1 Tax=Desertibaculum subflavum TaxID=2268458 RepID=UPI000E671DE0
MSSATTIRAASEADAARWDGFVEAAPDATFFHRFGWREVVANSFGHATHYLIAERGGAVVGVLPLVHQKTMLFGNGLISTAFCVEGGPIAADEEARAALDREALALLERTGAQYLEYRSAVRRHADWPAKTDLYAVFRRPITADRQKNLLAIPRKQRAVVRKALDQGKLKIAVDATVDRCFAVYAESVRNLGTPVFPKRYFANLKRVFSNDCEIVTVEDEAGSAVTSVMNFHFRQQVLPYYGGGTPAARGNGAYDLMYYEVMNKAAAERGATLFDFGRSKAGTGAFAYKKNWGFEPTFLQYEYRLQGLDKVPENNPLNPKYQLFIALWKKLPLPLANFLGPFVTRGLG